MIRRTLLLALSLSATVAQASWWPVLSDNYVTLQTGETKTLTVRAQWSGLVDYGFVPWRFESDNRSVAIVEGGLEQLGEAGQVKITAVGPGVTSIFLKSGGGPYCRIIVTRDDTPLQIAATAAVAGRPVRLTAVNLPPYATAQWFLGRTGDRTTPLGSGNEIEFTPEAPGKVAVWVWAESLTAASSSELEIEIAPPSRQRAVRH